MALCTIAHGAGTNFATLLGGAGQDYAAAVASDTAGNIYVAGLTYSPDFPVTPGAFQTIIGGNGTLANPNSIIDDAFVAKLSPNGTVLWATFLGGSGADYAAGIGVDSAGNVIVTGWTRSLDFPVLNAVQATNNGGWDAFVTKLDPTGSKLIYSTYLGSPGDDGAYALALDSAGDAYVTGSATAAGFTGFSSSASGYGMFVGKFSPQGALDYCFFNPNVNFAGVGAAAGIAVDSAGAAYVTGTAATAFPVNIQQAIGPSGTDQALVFKLSPDGSTIVYQTALGGSAAAYGMAIAVDATAAAYVAGLTSSVDFPLVNPVQSTFGARPLWKSTSLGVWTPIDNLPFAYLQVVVADPVTPITMYAGTSDRGVFKSLDGGVTWTRINSGIGGNVIQAIAIDPAQTQTLYAATGLGVTPGVVYKSVNGGSTWSAVDSSATGEALQVLIDAQSPNNIYAVWNTVGARKSTNAAATWTTLSFPGTSIAELAVDPQVSGNLWAYSTPIIVIKPLPGETSTPSYIWHSTDGGNTWTQYTSPQVGIPPTWMIDPSTNPSTVYNGLSFTTNNGASWTALPPSVVNGGETSSLTIAGGTLYAGVYNTGIYTSPDQGQLWTQIGSPVTPMTEYGFVMNVLDILPVNGAVYAVMENQQTSGFVTKLSPDGATIVFSTLLNGHVSMQSWNILASEPGVFLTQNWVSGIALDAANNVTVAGGTRALDFPTANPVQAANSGYADAFVTTISADGSKWNYSTYYGGSQDDSALAVTVDNQGNLVIVGQTWSGDFPAQGGTAAQAGYGDAFVVKLTPAGPPAIASVLNGASYQPGIEAGSWVMIKGSSLANTTRIWTTADFDGNDLPTSLSGVSVTIDGKPAFVYYISPTQINVLAPTDSATGTLNVVVDNNGALSAPAAAQLQTYAPAFFTELGTSSVVATLLPSYAPVSSTAPANPGGLVVLWGTGFGPTTPPAAAGTVVSGTPVTALPAVTVSGMPVTVISSVLTAGSAGLYQITIQLPANVPAGAVAVQASVGGAQTQAGTTIFIGQP